MVAIRRLDFKELHADPDPYLFHERDLPTALQERADQARQSVENWPPDDLLAVPPAYPAAL